MTVTEPVSLATSEPAELNSSVWAQGRYVSTYAHRALQPVEVLLFIRYHAVLCGRVLELGSGAGRLTGYLAELAEEAHGIDLAPAMIAEARSRYPNADFIQGDVRDLSAFADGSLDAVWAGCGILDIFGDGERRAMLDRIRRVLAPGGLLLLSSHNRAHLPSMPGPMALVRSRNPLTVLKDARHIPTRVRRHRQMKRLERTEPDYALVNNAAHDFSLIHYFIDRDAQFRQFEAAGLEPLVCLDFDGRPVGPGESASGILELQYVARRP